MNTPEDAAKQRSIDAIVAAGEAAGVNMHHPAAFVAFLTGNLESALVASTPGGIEAQEAQGQQALVTGDWLPKECLRCTRAQLEALGIVFGADADDLFVHVQLPPVWTREATDHHMWSVLRDAQGRPRAYIFYKAAFYDRRAFIRLERRYEMISGYAPFPQQYLTDEQRSLDGPSVCWVGVRDKVTDTILYHTEEYPANDWNAAGAADCAVQAWLQEHYPQWSDPLAYWEMGSSNPAEGV